MKPAVLVVDMQRGLFAEEPVPFEADQVVARINTLTTRARVSGVPVVFIQHERPATPVEQGSDGWQLLADIITDPADLFVRKTTPDSFLRTDLAELLSTLGVDTIVVCGFATEFCVDTTVRRGAALGHSVIVASDAHTTQDKPHASAAEIRAHHNATLADITSFGVRIEAVPTESIAFSETGLTST